MRSKTEDVFYLNDRYRTLTENREEVVAGIRRAGWRVAGLSTLMYAVTIILVFLLLWSRGQLATAKGFPTFIAVLTITMTVILLVAGVFYRNHARLFAEGEILKGTIDTITTRKNQGRDEVTIKYHFQTLLGEMLSGKQCYFLPNNKDGKGLPEVGATVAVLYRTNKQHIIL